MMPVEARVDNPLQWWWDKRQAYPILSRMARDYLSVQGMFPLSAVVHDLTS